MDFDSSYGHRRDVKGYADALEYFDSRLPELFDLLQDGDVVVLTADHGCDPTWNGTDHTRGRIHPGNCSTASRSRRVPSVVARPSPTSARASRYHGLPKLQYGTSFQFPCNTARRTSAAAK